MPSKESYFFPTFNNSKPDIQSVYQYQDSRYQSIIDMTTKVDKLKNLFIQKKIIDNFDESEIVQISQCQTFEYLDKIIQQNELGEDFRITLAEILLDNTKNFNQEASRGEDNSELEDLFEIAERARKMNQEFAEKYIKIFKLKAYLVKNWKNLELKEMFNLENLMIQRQQLLHKIQHLITKEGWMNSTLQEAISKALISQESDESFIQKVSKQIMPIDIDLLQKYIERSSTAGSKIEGQTGVVKIGETGAGKSTIILGLLGHELVEKKWEGLPWITPNKILDYDKDIKNIVAVPSVKSVTKNVTAIKVQQQMIEKGLDKDVFLVDTPGFNDTRGSIMDIANTFGTTRAVRSLKSARFVILFCGKDEKSRSEGIIQMAQTINKLFPNYQKVKASVIFVFNRYTQVELSSMSNKLKSIWKELPSTSKDNQNLKVIYNDMINKTRDPKQILVFDPIKKDKQYMKNFLSLILKYPKVYDVASIFSVCYGEGVKNDIEQQVRVLKDFCLNFFETGQINICKYYVEKLHKFASLMKTKDNPYVIENAIKKIQEKITEKLESKCVSIIQTFNKLIDFCYLTTQNINQYTQQAKKSSLIYKTLEQYLNIPNIQQRLEDNMNDKIDPLIQNFNESVSHIEGKTIECLVTLLTGSGRKSRLVQVKNKLEEQLSELSDKYRQNIKQANFKLCIDSYHKYKSVLNVTEHLNHKQKGSQAKSAPNIDDIILSELNRRFSFVEGFVNDYSKCSISQLNKIKEISDFFKILEESSEYLRIIDNRAQVKSKIQQFNTKVTEKVTKIFEEMEGKINQKQNFSKQEINSDIQLYRLRDQLLKIPHLKNTIYDLCCNIAAKSAKIFNSAQKSIGDFVKQVNEQKIGIHKLKFMLLKLDAAILNLQKIKAFAGKQSQYSNDDIKQKMECLLTTYLTQIEEIYKHKIDLEDSDTVKQIQSLGNISEVIMAFDKHQNKLSSKIFEDCDVVKLLDSIKSIFGRISDNNIKLIEEVGTKLQISVNSKQKQEPGADIISNIKLKQIESCLSLADMGQSVFQKQKQKYLLFKNLYDGFVVKITSWRTILLSQIQQKFEVLAKVELENMKEIVHSLKKMIEIRISISKKYPEISKIFEDTKNQSEVEIEDEILNLQKIYRNMFKSYQKDQCCSSQSLQVLEEKCKLLTSLDAYTQYKNLFSELCKAIRKTGIKFADNQFDKLKFVAESKNYEQVSKHFAKLCENQSQQNRIGEAIDLVAEIFRGLLDLIKRALKSKQKTTEDIEESLEAFDELIKAKTVLLTIPQIDSNQTISVIVTESEQLFKSILSNINDTYQSLIKQIERYLERNNIEKAYVRIKSLQKIESIKNRSKIKKQAGEEKSDIYTKQIECKLDSFESKYICAEEVKLNTFRDEYETFFEQSQITCPDLFSLKKKINQRISNIIHQKDIDIEKKQYYTKNDLLEIKWFACQLPEQLRSKKSCSSLVKHAIQKLERWEKQKVEMKDEAQRTDPFTKEGMINPKIMNYCRDPTADKLTKVVIRNKIENQLKAKVKVYSKEGLLGLTRLLDEAPQMKMTEEVKTQKNFEDIREVYFSIRKSINQNVIKMVKKDVEELEQCILQNDNYRWSECEIESNTKTFIDKHTKYTLTLEKQYLRQLILDHTMEQIKNRIDQFFINISTLYKKTKEKLNNLKYILDTNESQGQYKFHISQINKLRIVQKNINFMIDFIKNVKEISCSTSYFLSKLEQITQLFTISVFANKVQEVVVSKYQALNRFSLNDKKMMAFMDKAEIDRELREKQNWLKYINFIYVPLLSALQMNDIIQRSSNIKKLQQKLDEQADAINKQIMQYVKNPVTKDDVLQDIRCKLMVLQKYSLIFHDKQNIAKVFESSIKGYHKQILSLSKIILQDGKKQQDKNKLEVKKQTDQLQKQKERELKQNEKVHQVRMSMFKSDLDDRTKGMTSSEIQEQRKCYDSDIETEKCLYEQERKMRESFYDEKIEKIMCQFQQTTKSRVRQVAKNYERMVSITQSLVPCQELNNDNERLLKQIKTLGKKKWMKFLLDGLKGISSTTSGAIIANNVELRQLMDTYFSKNIQSLTFEQVVEQFRKQNSTIVNESFKAELQKKSQLCFTHYNHWIEQYKNNQKETKNNLIIQLKNHNQHNVSNEVSLNLLGKIFALWTIITSKIEDGLVIYNYRPHPAQIISAVLLLGLVNYKDCKGFSNRFAEIKTGQGKSLILAVTSSYFALNGFEVDCVCYSEHLSSRDREAFENLFSTLNIESSIKYCTFNQLTESYTNNNEIKLRRCCNQLIQNGKITYTGQCKEYDGKVNNKILLIDQVDVFFIDEFYGNYYSPSAQLRSQSIKNLYSFIWNNRHTTHNFKNLILSSLEMKQVLSEFPKFQDLIKNQVNEMISGVRHYQHEYQVIDNKIAYKNQDGYSDKISYGYKTTFAYFYLHSKGRITQLGPSASSIDIALCQISFAELPKMYEYILGVSGSLRNLSDCKKQIMKDEYKITENYAIPSVYRKPTRYDDGYKFVEQKDHSTEIVKNLQYYHEKRRPVLVFFDTLYAASDMYDKDIYKPYRDFTVILSQKHNADERKRRIMRSMSEGKISFITRAFARGIDFIIYESNVVTLGGAHMIVTFTIEEKSEEMQILGRVARQGDPGSSIFIISKEDLHDKLQIVANDNFTKLSQRQIQGEIDEARERKAVQKQKLVENSLQKCKTKHQEAIKLFNHIRLKNEVSVLDYLLKLNLVPELVEIAPVKTVLAIDATGSMTAALATTRQSLAIAFERIYNILKQGKVDDGFQLQVVVYRNYNCKQDTIFVSTPFQNRPEQLANFVRGIQPMGGMGHEALEIVYNYCLSVQDLKQLIIIGDNPANTKEQTIQKRQCYGEAYWASTQKYKVPLNRDILISQIKSSKLPVHALSIGSYPKAYFDEITRMTNGRHQDFVPGRGNDSINQLTHFISTCILQKAGQRTGKSKQLVESYRKTYKA